MASIPKTKDTSSKNYARIQDSFKPTFEALLNIISTQQTLKSDDPATTLPNRHSLTTSSNLPAAQSPTKPNTNQAAR